MENVYIVMPAYNEAMNIESVVRQWHPIVEQIGATSKLVIVDDGSTDVTYSTLQQLTQKYSQLIPITKKNSGHGSTCLFAYHYAIEQQSNYIFQTDSDGQTEPQEFWKFWQLRHDYNFIAGLRTKRQDGFNRVMVTKVLKLFVWIMLGVKVNDANVPFRLISTNTLKKYIALIPPDFFLVNVLISAIFVLKKEHYLWLPITFKNRQGGVNSINLQKIFRIGLQAMKDFKMARQQL